LRKRTRKYIFSARAAKKTNAINK